jgi:hypothetical protein
MVSQLEPSGTNWIKTKENFASREKIRKWKTGFSIKTFRNAINLVPSVTSAHPLGMRPHSKRREIKIVRMATSDWSVRNYMTELK